MEAASTAANRIASRLGLGIRSKPKPLELNAFEIKTMPINFLKTSKGKLTASPRKLTVAHLMARKKERDAEGLCSGSGRPLLNII